MQRVSHIFHSHFWYQNALRISVAQNTLLNEGIYALNNSLNKFPKGIKDFPGHLLPVPEAGTLFLISDLYTILLLLFFNGFEFLIFVSQK